jgi:hypothetical protein
MAQAAPGPLPQPAQSQAPSAQATPKPKPQEIKPRTTLDGAWRLNPDESDDPRARAKDTRGTNGGNGGGNPSGGYPGGGRYPGGGYPGGGYPGGGYPGGGYPGGGGGRRGGQDDGGRNTQNDEQIQELIRPANSLTFVLKNAEVDVTDERYQRVIFFTDGRPLQKSTIENYKEIAAHWDGSRLVSDEKTPQGGKMSRTFELSSDGRQVYETWNIDRGKNRSPLSVRYVFDIAIPQNARATRESDPDQPVLKRSPGSGDGASAPQSTQSGNDSDPNKPVLKRHDDNNTPQ